MTTKTKKNWCVKCKDTFTAKGDLESIKKKSLCTWCANKKNEAEAIEE